MRQVYGFLTRDNPLRAKCIELLDWPWFDRIIMFLILISSILMAVALARIRAPHRPPPLAPAPAPAPRVPGPLREADRPTLPSTRRTAELPRAHLGAHAS